MQCFTIFAIKPVKAELGYFGDTKFSKFDSKQYKLNLLLQAHIIANCPMGRSRSSKGGDGNSSNRFGH